MQLVNVKPSNSKSYIPTINSETTILEDFDESDNQVVLDTEGEYIFRKVSNFSHL